MIFLKPLPLQTSVRSGASLWRPRRSTSLEVAAALGRGAGIGGLRVRELGLAEGVARGAEPHLSAGALGGAVFFGAFARKLGGKPHVLWFHRETGRKTICGWIRLDEQIEGKP